jgi:putative PEP-CTERM system TPR-repeat lipoprotein
MHGMRSAPAPFNRQRLRSRAAWVLVVALSACKPAALPGAADKPDAAAAARALPLAEEARKRLQQGDAAGALEPLQTALKADRSRPALHQLLAQVQLALGDVVAAEAAYSDALRLGADRNELVLPLAAALAAQGQPQALLDQSRLDDAGLLPHVRQPLLLMKAQAAADLGQAAAAQRHIDAARAIDPAQAAPWLVEAGTRLRDGAMAPAAAAADKALALAPQSPAALAARADVALAMGDRAAALAGYERAIAAAPGSPAAHEARVARTGLLLEKSPHGPLAAPLAAEVETLRKAVPGDLRLSYLAALVAERQGDADAARSALAAVTQTLQRVPAEALRYRPQALMLGALAHLGLGETERARGYLDQLAQHSGVSAGPATRLLAQSHLTDNNLERGITVLEAHIKQHPADQQALLMLVGAQLALGRHTRAINLLQDTLARKDSPAVRGMLAAAHVSTGGLQAGQSEIALALKTTPGHLGLQAALCAMLLHSGQPAKAVQAALVLVQREPAAPGWQHLLGVAQLRAGQVAAARSAFEAAARLDDGFAAPRVALARLEAAAGALDAAVAQLQAVLRQQPGNSDALFEMGRVQLQLQQSAPAQAWFEKAQAAAAPGDIQASLALFDLQLGQRRLPAAAAVLRPLALRQPDEPLVLLAQARLAQAGNEGTAARTLLTRATGLAGYEAGALLQVALLQMQAAPPAGAASGGIAANTTASARYALEKALVDNPGLLAAHALMVDVELRQREFERAQARVQSLLASHPRQAVVHALHGDVSLARGQTAAALAAYRRAHQLEPSGAHVLRIHRAWSQTDPGAANAYAGQWLEQRPADHAVRRALAAGLARLGQYAAARSHYESIVNATPGDSESLNNLAHLLLLLKDPAAATVAERALEAQPDVPHIMATAGWANVQAGQTERGMNWLRYARLREPGNADTLYFMAAALAQQGRKDEARAEVAGALKLGKAFVHARDAQQLLESLR